MKESHVNGRALSESQEMQKVQDLILAKRKALYERQEKQFPNSSRGKQLPSAHFETNSKVYYSNRKRVLNAIHVHTVNFWYDYMMQLRACRINRGLDIITGTKYHNRPFTQIQEPRKLVRWTRAKIDIKRPIIIVNGVQVA